MHVSPFNSSRALLKVTTSQQTFSFVCVLAEMLLCCVFIIIIHHTTGISTDLYLICHVNVSAELSSQKNSRTEELYHLNQVENVTCYKELRWFWKKTNMYLAMFTLIESRGAVRTCICVANQVGCLFQGGHREETRDLQDWMPYRYQEPVPA